MMFVEQILNHLKNNASSPWMHEVHGDQLKTISKKHFAALIAGARISIQSMGVKKGDRVVLLGSNSAKWIACDLAIISLGAITVPLYHRQDPKELVFMADDCEPSLFIYADETLKNEVCKTWNCTCKSAQLDLLFSNDVAAVPTCEKLEDKDPATIIYTSGTSGHPKGVIITHGNIDFMLERTTNQLYQAKGNQDNADRVFHFLPLCFAGSRMMLWTQLHRNNPVYLSIDLKNLVQEMSVAAPMFYLNVPAILERIRTGVETKINEKGGMIARLYKKAMHLGFAEERSLFQNLQLSAMSLLILSSVRKKIGKNLTFLICGSAALHPDTQKWFQLLGIKILQVYGLTETTAIISMDDPKDVQTGLVGKAIQGVKIKTSEEGELLSKGPNVFSGYWKRPEETRNSFTDDGWFKSGDLAEITNSGHIRITGRLKNLIIPTSGHNIVPEPIEEQLQKFCPKIEHAVLVGHGKPFLSVIVTGSASQPEIQVAIDHINENVPHYRKIKTFVHHKDGFTVENGLLTVNQKIKRRAVETLLFPQIEQIYSGATA
jgi:long-chain acyl-CoA synthetase